MRNKLRALRLEKGLTQRKLGEMTGPTNTAIGMIERGKSDGLIKNWKAIAEALGVKDWASLQQVDAHQ